MPKIGQLGAREDQKIVVLFHPTIIPDLILSAEGRRGRPSGWRRSTVAAGHPKGLYAIPTISTSSASGSAPQRHGNPTLPNPRDTTRSDDRKAYTPSSRQNLLCRIIGGPFGRRICPPCV